MRVEQSSLGLENCASQSQPPRLWPAARRRSFRRRIPAANIPLLIAVLVVVLLWPGHAMAQDGVIYVVRPGDSLGAIAASYGTTVAAIMQANGLSSPNMVRAGQSLRIPIQQSNAGTKSPTGAVSYTVRLGDTLGSIADSLGVDAAALASANGLADPDRLYVGQQLLVPGTASGRLGVAGAQNAGTGGRYVVRPGDTLSSIASALGVTVADLQAANNLPNAGLLVVGQKLTIPKPGAVAPSPAAPVGLGAALPPGSPPSYVVRPGDTLNAIAERLGVTGADLAKLNNLGDVDVLSIGQRLLIPGSGAPGAAPSSRVVEQPSAAPAEAAPSPAAAPPESTRHTVVAGETLSSIAQQYNTTAAEIARLNRLTSPDTVSAGMNLVIPAGDWTASNLSGRPSRFVASISEQHCWLYQGDQLVASWICSTGRPGSDTVPGTYRIQSKMDKGWGSALNMWLPYWLGIYWAGTTENGIHSFPYDAKTGAKLWEGMVGTPVTFGCILLDPEHAKELYDVAYIGMPVIIQP